MAALPPYDVIIFFVVWIITMISWAMTYLFRTRSYCCTYLADSDACSLLCGTVSSNSAPETIAQSESLTKHQQQQPQEQEEMRNSGEAAIHVLAT